MAVRTMQNKNSRREEKASSPALNVTGTEIEQKKKERREKQEKDQHNLGIGIW
jgi:hypothetical protein